MSKKKLASNFALRFVVTGIEKVAGVILLPVLVAYLGVDGYGYFALVLSLSLVYSNVLTLRLPIAVIRFYPQHRQQAGPVVIVGLLYWALLVGAFLMLLPFVGERLATYMFGKPGLLKLFIASVSIGLLSMLYEFVTITFRAENRFKFLSVVDGLERTVYVGLCVLVLLLGYSSVEAVCAVLMLTMLGKILVTVRSALKGIRWSWPNAALAREMFLFSLPYLPCLASIWLLERGAFFYLGKSDGPAAVGAFAIAFSLAGVLGSAMGPLQTVLYPLVRQTYDTGDLSHGKELLTMALRMILSVGAFGTLALCTGVQHIFQLLSIHAPTPGFVLLLCLCAAVVMSLIRHLLVIVLNLEMNTKVLAWTAPVVAVVCLPVYLLFIGWFGATGAALSYFVAVAANTFSLAKYVPRMLFPVPSSRYAFALLCSSAAAGAVQWVFSNLGLWQYLTALLLSGILYLALSFRLGAFTDGEKQMILRLVRIPGMRPLTAGQ